MHVSIINLLPAVYYVKYNPEEPEFFYDISFSTHRDFKNLKEISLTSELGSLKINPQDNQ